MTATTRTQLPVVRWLQVGAAAAGLGLAMAAAPAIASADDGTAVSASDAGQSAAGASHRSAVRQTAGNDAPRANRSAGPARAVASGRRAANKSPGSTATTPLPAARSVTVAPAAAGAAESATPVVAAAVAQPKASASASTAPSAAPGFGSFSATVRLNLEDLFSGSGKPAVTNPTAVVNGLFQEVLRRDPTATELQNYLKRLKFSGVNAVVAGLYTSQAFRQNAVTNYYLELLGRTPTQQELSWGTLQLGFGTAPNFAASLAGGDEFYNGSASGGGEFGTPPSATTYVDLLYRSLLGQATGPTAAPLVQSIQGGLRISRAANQFVKTDAYRTVKVGEVYQVLGQTGSSTDIAGYVDNWVWSGGQSGISMSLLATTTNMQRLETGQVTFPDVVAAAKLKQLLLAPYTDGAEGFVKLFNNLLSLDPGNPISETNPCTASNTSCDQALYRLITTGGADRGIPNSSLQLTSITANVATLVPTQNEIDLKKSLKFPLQDPGQLQTFFTGGIIQPFGSPVVTANNGTYILDGHHRWSGIVLINPYTQVTALDLGYVPMPQNGLEEAQMGVAAAKGYLAVAEGGGINLYNCDQATFDTAVRGYIETADEAHKDQDGNLIPAPNPPGGTWTDQVLAVFGKNLGFDPGTTPLDEQYTIVENYLWGNVLRMREKNPFIPGATSRAVMPQTDPLPVVQTYLASGALSYSFPTISYLG